MKMIDMQPQPQTTPETFRECTTALCENCSQGNGQKYQFISCELRTGLQRESRETREIIESIESIE